MVSGPLSLDGTKIVAIALVYGLCLVVNSRIAKMTNLKIQGHVCFLYMCEALRSARPGQASSLSVKDGSCGQV